MILFTSFAKTDNNSRQNCFIRRYSPWSSGPELLRFSIIFQLPQLKEVLACLLMTMIFGWFWQWTCENSENLWNEILIKCQQRYSVQGSADQNKFDRGRAVRFCSYDRTRRRPEKFRKYRKRQNPEPDKDQQYFENIRLAVHGSLMQLCWWRKYSWKNADKNRRGG